MSVEEMLEKLVFSLDHETINSSDDAFKQIEGLDQWIRLRSKYERAGMVSQSVIDVLRKNGPAYA